MTGLGWLDPWYEAIKSNKNKRYESVVRYMWLGEQTVLKMFPLQLFDVHRLLSCLHSKFCSWRKSSILIVLKDYL